MPRDHLPLEFNLPIASTFQTSLKSLQAFRNKKEMSAADQRSGVFPLLLSNFYRIVAGPPSFLS